MITFLLQYIVTNLSLLIDPNSTMPFPGIVFFLIIMHSSSFLFQSWLNAQIIKDKNAPGAQIMCLEKHKVIYVYQTQCKEILLTFGFEDLK